MTNPHDALFKYTFSQPEHAAQLIRDNLPASVAERIEWATLERLPGSFVDRELAWRHTDLLFQARLSGRQGLIYLLVEHQSTADPLMAMRLLAYMVRIWEQVVKQDPNIRLVPAIIPLVLYHGSKTWSSPTGFVDLVDLDAPDKSALAAFLPDFRFLLDDLSGRSDQQLRARAMTQLGILTLLSLQRLPSAADPVAALAEMSDLIVAVINAPSGMEALTAILCYLFKVSDSDTETVKEVLQSRVGPKVVEAFMTTAERLIQQGRAEGEARGRAEGRAEGEARGRAELFKKLVTLKFGPLSPEMEKRVSSAAIADLDRWSERMLNAQRIEDVFN